jgi:hypothetical protein
MAMALVVHKCHWGKFFSEHLSSHLPIIIPPMQSYQIATTKWTRKENEKWKEVKTKEKEEKIPTPSNAEVKKQ